MQNLIIRPYEPNDEKEVLRLWQLCGIITPHNNPRTDIERKLSVNPEWFLIGVLANRIVATCMAGYEGHRGWINYLAVSPAHRRRGVATQMMAEAEKKLGAAGCPKINLQVRETNADVTRFYESIGYIKDPVTSLGKRLVSDAPFRVE